MYTTKIDPNKPVFLNSEGSKKLEKKDFDSILSQFMGEDDNSLMKTKTIELEGALIPCRVWILNRMIQFKLRIEERDIPLNIPHDKVVLAKTCLYDDVRVRGKFDALNSIFNVEKIFPLSSGNDFEFSEFLSDRELEFEGLKRRINKFGKLEPSPGLEAS